MKRHLVNFLNWVLVVGARVELPLEKPYEYASIKRQVDGTPRGVFSYCKIALLGALMIPAGYIILGICKLVGFVYPPWRAI